MKNKKYLGLLFMLTSIVFLSFGELKPNHTEEICTPCTTQSGWVSFTDQADIDDWVAANAGCTTIDGTLRIGPGWSSTPTDIHDLSGLMSLEEVTGVVVIHNTTDLVDLTGLNNLHTIGDKLHIDHTIGLTNLSALGNLQNMVGGSYVRIEDNASIQNLDGLQGLSNIEEFEILDNYNLETLDGLENLTEVEEFTISNNVNLSSIQALSNLQQVEHLDIISNNNLPTLSGLEGLNYVTDILIDNNASLQDLNGLHNIDTIGNDDSSFGINILNCPSLTDFSGLQSLKIIKGNLIVSNNGITSLGGLESLDSIGNAFWLDDNYSLLSLDGIENLRKINQNFLIRRNDQLTDLTAISNSLEDILFYFQIIDNDELLDLSGLENLVNVANFQVEKNDKLLSLNGLSPTTNFGGLFQIGWNNTLPGLSGLEDFTSLPRLIIRDNPALTNLDALSNTAETISLYIQNNDLLQNLNGLEKVESVQTTFYIGKNDLLDNIEGLRKLNSIGEDFTVEQNENLKNFKGLEGLQTILGNVSIKENAALHELRGLDNLSNIGGYLSIYDNDQLYKINSLGELQSLGSGMNIISNQIIQSIDGLDKLVSIDGSVVVTYNPNLEACFVHFICRHLINNGDITMNDNKEGCNDPNLIKDNCGISTFIGKVVLDQNFDCLPNSNEPTLQGWKVQATSADIDNSTFTNDQGEYILNVDTGEYNVNVVAPFNIWQPCIINQTYDVSASYDTLTVDFSNQGLVQCPIMTVELSSTPIRRCMNSTFKVSYCNYGTTVAEDAYVEVFLNDFLTITDAVLPYTQDGVVYDFSLGDIDPGFCSSFSFQALVSCDAVIDQTLCATAVIYPDTLCEIPSSGWTGAGLFVNSFCGVDEVIFSIENNGDGDMVEPTEYRVFKDGIPFDVGTVQLPEGNIYEVAYSKDGSTYRIEVDQVSNYPIETTPGITIEACADSNDSFSTGYALQLPIEDYGENFDRHCLPITGSFDPNDKRGFPLGYGVNHYIESNKTIDYMIRFQNTGNDTAFLVVILDTLPVQLDPTTIDLGSYSHDNRVEILDGNVMEFRFENIILPDSNINEPASHGYITFKIDQRPDLPFGTEIINSAAIYFDFNEPIITENSIHKVGYETHIISEEIFVCEGDEYQGIIYEQDTTFIDTLDFGVVLNIDKEEIIVIPPIQTIFDTTLTIGASYQNVIYETDTTIQEIYTDQYGCDSTVQVNISISPLSTNNLNVQNPSVIITPNPFTAFTQFEIENLKVKKGIFEMYNSVGDRVRIFDFYENKFNLNRLNLIDGIYFYRLVLDGEKIMTGKLVVY